MRIFPSVRQIWSGYIRLFRIRSIPCAVTPAQDTEATQDGFVATGKDTQLKVSPTTTLLSTGWYRLTYEADYEGDDHLFVPKIFPGYLLDEASSETSPFRTFPSGSLIALRAHFPGQATHFFHYDFDPEGFRFDPFELDYPRTRIHYSGKFKLSGFCLTYYGSVSFLLLCLGHVLKRHGQPRRKRVIGKMLMLLRKRGLEGALRWLAHETHMNLQAPFSPTTWYENLKRRPENISETHSLESSPVSKALSLTLFIAADAASPEDLASTVDSALAQTRKIDELIILANSKTPKATCLAAQGLAQNQRSVRYAVCEYRDFEKALNLATGDLISLTKAGDSLVLHAADSLASGLAESNADIAYGDEVIMEDSRGRIHKTILRSAFCLDHFLGYPALGRLTAVRRNLLQKTSPFAECESDEAVNEQLILEALHRTRRIVHVPRILLERPKAQTSPNSRRLPALSILEFLKSLGFPQATVEPTATPGLYSIRYRQAPSGKTGIVIPTKNNGDLLKLAVQSLEKTVPRTLYDLVIVDHESDDPATLDLLDTIASRHRVISYEGMFNFSRINNVAVECFNEEIDSFLFLNNDIEAIHTGWLEAMRDLLSRKDVGIVGATLLYPPKDPAVPNANVTNGAPGAVSPDSCLIQHAGVMLNIGLAEHYQKCERYRDAYQQGASQNPAIPHLVTRTFSAVTAACMLARRDVFETLGGFDDALAVGYQDVDLCLRAQNQGYKTLCSAEAVLFHHESVTRGLPDPDHAPPRPAHLDLTLIDEKDPHPEDTVTFSQRYHDLIGKDPFYSPMLSRSTAFYRPLRVPARSDDFDNQVISFERPRPL